LGWCVVSSTKYRLGLESEVGGWGVGSAMSNAVSSSNQNQNRFGATYDRGFGVQRTGSLPTVEFEVQGSGVGVLGWGVEVQGFRLLLRVEPVLVLLILLYYSQA